MVKNELNIQKEVAELKEVRIPLADLLSTEVGTARCIQALADQVKKLNERLTELEKRSIINT